MSLWGIWIMMMFTRKWSRVWSQLALQIYLASFAAAEINNNLKKTDKQVLFKQVWHRSKRWDKPEWAKNESRSSDITVAVRFYCINPASTHTTRHISTPCTYDMMTAHRNAVPSSSGEQQRQFLWLLQNSSRIVRERNAVASLHSWCPFQANHKSHHEYGMMATCIINVHCGTHFTWCVALKKEWGGLLK